MILIGECYEPFTLVNPSSLPMLSFSPINKIWVDRDGARLLMEGAGPTYKFSILMKILKLIIYLSILTCILKAIIKNLFLKILTSLL